MISIGKGKNKSKLLLPKTWASEIRRESPAIKEMNHKVGQDFARAMELKAKSYRGGKEGGGWHYIGAKYGSAPKWGAISKVWPQTPWIRRNSDIWAKQVASQAGLKPSTIKIKHSRKKYGKDYGV